MNAEFSWWTALTIFVGYFAVDWLVAYYTMAVVRKRALMASHSGAGIYLLTSYGVINYTHNWWYIVFVVLGAWLGTYVYVRYTK